MIQCLNDAPKFRDKTDSMLRRIIFVPFDKCFTGRERKYIKEDYLKTRRTCPLVTAGSRKRSWRA